MAKDIGKKLRKLRRLRKITTTDLARICDIHQTTISAIESGKHSSPGVDTIQKLAKALRISPLYFFEDTVVTPFDLVENLPDDVYEFLLREESLAYLKLSQEAYEKGISSSSLQQLLDVLKQAAKHVDLREEEMEIPERKANI